MRPIRTAATGSLNGIRLMFSASDAPVNATLIDVTYANDDGKPYVLPRAASVVGMVLLLHSLVEFPLRMPALACIFAAMMAILIAPAPRRHNHVGHGAHNTRGASPSRRERHQPAPDAPRRASAATVPPKFSVRRGGEDARRDDTGATNEGQTRR